MVGQLVLQVVEGVNNTAHKNYPGPKFVENERGYRLFQRPKELGNSVKVNDFSNGPDREVAGKISSLNLQDVVISMPNQRELALVTP